ncbi:MAG: hypothetical protein LBH35_01120, partial [Treponema sp.]|nr:hypothetical protein [Treponema sp.]
MKTSIHTNGTGTRRLLVLAAVLAVFAGCGNPWMRSVLAPFYTDAEEAMNMEDFGVAVPTSVRNIGNDTEWYAALAAIAASGSGNYVINVTGNILLTSLSTFGPASNTVVSLRGGGSLRHIHSSSLFTILNGQRLIIRNITLRGDTTNSHPLLYIDTGAMATLRTGGAIEANFIVGDGAGVYVDGGHFSMEGGTI